MSSSNRYGKAHKDLNKVSEYKTTPRHSLNRRFLENTDLQYLTKHLFVGMDSLNGKWKLVYADNVAEYSDAIGKIYM